MLKPHLTRDSAEQYILGALPPEKAAALEAHTLECEPCALLLQEEAVLSEQLEEVASAFPREDRVIRPARWHARRVAAGAVGAALAAAASLALILLPGGRGVPSPGPGAPGVTSPVVDFEMAEQQNNFLDCPDLATQDSCLRDAQDRGLLVQNPRGTLDVPRYEARTGLPEGALSARRPVSL
ncbi:zf-HC2 domain-containing protein [Pyxidicoccus xibeiensis]|uniref:zf-HC2 domain-containing protein n=1 Tax=Pyxidicoccus xibeiensis TaxID=2906759 RepID=UPI0020A6FA68|nr:zf-HC2 domain-containing protein [Pyxidicoccus xibeiensis]MCP3138796.1 zf-HC2 domain-containing protein [Pyxidicoccus xibeiensis]